MLLHPVILQFDSLESTNSEAERQATLGSPEGLFVIAREQTKGRGRRQRSWLSPLDAGLYMSVVLRPRLRIERWPLISLMAALAVVEGVEVAYGLNDLDIKWPNDVLGRGRKLSGILAEIVETGTGRACILGIGVNLRKEVFPEELQSVAVSVEELIERAPERELLLNALVEAIRKWYDALNANRGAEEILESWQARSSTAWGRRVSVNGEGFTLRGITRGLEPDGALRLETAGGKIEILRAGDISLRVGI